MAEELDLTPAEGAEAADITAPEPTPLPSFSVIIPTWGDVPALERTLTNLIVQSCDMDGCLVPRDLIVVGDGEEAEVTKLVGEILTKLASLPHVRIGYYTLPQHTGSGDYPRTAAKKYVERDWVVFIDSGTAVQRNFFWTLAKALHEQPDAKLITWDMWQQLDPSPLLSNARAVYDVDRSNGLPYVLPGCATAVRADVYRLVDWPVIYASDWVYFSQLWDKLYLQEDGTRTDTPEQLDKDVIVIPWTLTAAYAARSERKHREPPTPKQMEGRGWHIGFNQARAAALEAKKSGGEGSDSGTVSVPETAHA